MAEAIVPSQEGLPQKPQYQEALQEKLDEGRKNRETLMKEFGLAGFTADWTDYRQGALAGPTGEGEVQFTRAEFLRTLKSREETLTQQAARMIGEGGKTPDEAAIWLAQRLDALNAATRTVLNVVAVRHSATEDTEKQTLDAVEILGYLDDAALFLATLDVEDFIQGQTQSGDLPRFLQHVTETRIKAADETESMPDRLTNDDYAYIIQLLPDHMDVTQFAQQMRQTETQGTPLQITGQQMAEVFTFGALYGQMTEQQRMKFFTVLMEAPQKKETAVPLVVAMAEQGVLQPSQAERLLRIAEEKSLITEAEFVTHIAQKQTWSEQALQVERLQKEMQERFGRRLDENAALEMSQGGVKLGGLLLAGWGAITALINMAMGRGKPNEYALLGFAAVGAGVDIMSGGGCQRAIGGLVEKFSQPHKMEQETIRREVAHRPAAVACFIDEQNYRAIRGALLKRKQAEPPKPEEIKISEWQNKNPELVEKALAEAGGETEEEKILNVEGHLLVLYRATRAISGKADEKIDLTDVSPLITQQQKELGLDPSATV